MRRTLLAFIALASAFLAGPLASRPAEAAGPDHLDCAYPFWVGFAPVHLANVLGYFKDEGITVKEIIDDDISNAYAAMERGDIDCYLRSVGEYQGRPRKPETQGIIIGTIDESNGGDGVVADGSVKSICDLKGKTVATEPNLPATLILQMALKSKCNVTFDQLHRIDIASSDAGGIFADKSVAAVGAYEPVLTQTVDAHRDRGAYVIVSSRDYPHLITDTIIARTENLKSQPEKYVKLLRAIYRAMDYYEKNPDKAIPIMAEHFQLKAAEFKETVKNINYIPLDQSVMLMGIDGKPGKLFEIFDTVMQLNLENRASDAPLKAAQQIDNSIITKVWNSRAQ
jgi:NitT/TauT family transport system substrate-binding protein